MKKLAYCIAIVVLAYAPRALACFNDTDCGATCGGMVCSFAAATYQTCVAASTGDPGWCTSNAGCQCQGATCNLTTHYCSATMPGGNPDAATTPPDMTAPKGMPDLAAAPVVNNTSSSSGCDVGGGAPSSGLLMILGLALAGILVRRRSAV